MDLPKVSIIITAYSPKAKPYLDLCAESVRNPGEPYCAAHMARAYVPLVAKAREGVAA